MAKLWTLVLILATALPLAAQSAPSTPSFDVASVKPNTSDNSNGSSNSPLGPGDVFVDTGGFFSATNLPFTAYLFFAYKIQGNQSAPVLAALPAWAATDRFDIQARTSSHPTKDQMRLLVRALLAERFALRTHYETRDAQVFALELVKPGKTGPQLRARPADAPCQADDPSAIDAGFPTFCGGVVPLAPKATRPNRFGAGKITMPFLANQLSAMGRLGRPVIDQTGLSGVFDFTLEWSPESADQQSPDTLTFLEAVREQLGLRMTSQKHPEEFLAIDHVEHPTGN